MKQTVNIELLHRFLRKETTSEEEQKLLTWFRSKEGQEELFSFYKNQWAESANQPLTDIEIQEKMYREIKARIKASQTKDKKSHRIVIRLSKIGLQYAAIVLLCIGFGFYIYTNQQANNKLVYTVESEKGQRSNIILPDGTKVWLNSHSSLKYNANYGKEERNVTLTGEAFFEVTKDKKHRFSVNTENIQIEALGTSFNVKAYRDDKTITTTLFTGKIKITTDLQDTILSEGEQVLYSKENKGLTKNRPEVLEYINMWKCNELAFDGETLNEIGTTLNRMYNVEVRFESDKIKNYRFSGVIRNNSLDNIIEIISLTAPIEYRSEGDTIYLSEKQSL